MFAFPFFLQVSILNESFVVVKTIHFLLLVAYVATYTTFATRRNPELQLNLAKNFMNVSCRKNFFLVVSLKNIESLVSTKTQEI